MTEINNYKYDKIKRIKIEQWPIKNKWIYHITLLAFVGISLYDPNVSSKLINPKGFVDTRGWNDLWWVVRINTPHPQKKKKKLYKTCILLANKSSK